MYFRIERVDSNCPGTSEPHCVPGLGSLFSPDHQAGSCRGRNQLVFSIANFALGKRDAIAGSCDSSFRGQLLADPWRPKVVHVQIDRDVSDTGRERRVNRATHHGVKQSAHESSMHEAQWVQDIAAGFGREDDLAAIRADRLDVEELPNRCAWKFSANESLHQLQSIHRGDVEIGTASRRRGAHAATAASWPARRRANIETPVPGRSVIVGWKTTGLS